MPGRHSVSHLGDELAKIARPRHQQLVSLIARRAGVESGDGIRYAVDRLADLPLHLRVGVDVLALGLAAMGPERSVDLIHRLPVPLIDMYPKLVRSIVLFATYDPRDNGS